MIGSRHSKQSRRRRAVTLRRGTTLVEFAFLGPMFLLILIGLIVGGLGVFRYHQVTALAHEAVRYASVHGRDYARITGQPKATSETVLRDVIGPRSSGLDPTQLTCELAWGTDESSAIVTVIVRYQWTPEALWTPIVFTSTAHAFVTY